MKTELGVGALCAALCVAPLVGAADIYPAKPIRIIVAYTPAGTTDILARTIGQKFTDVWKQPVVIENRPGANGNIGTDLAAKSAPDGYTLLMTTAGPHGINPTLYKKLPFDAVKDFAPVSLVAMVPNILVVHPSLPVKNVAELIQLAKSKPGALSFGSPGNGSTGHLSTELFKSMTGVNMVHIPYKGSAGVLSDLMGGQVQVAIDNMPPYVPQVKAGKVRALAVTTAKRSSAAPELPSIGETVSGYEAAAWFGLVAPAGTPKDIIDKLSAETAKVLKMPDVREKLAAQGAEAVGNSPEEFGAFIKSEIAKWAKVVRESGAKAE